MDKLSFWMRMDTEGPVIVDEDGGTHPATNEEWDMWQHIAIIEAELAGMTANRDDWEKKARAAARAAQGEELCDSDFKELLAGKQKIQDQRKASRKLHRKYDSVKGMLLKVNADLTTARAERGVLQKRIRRLHTDVSMWADQRTLNGITVRRHLASMLETLTPPPAEANDPDTYCNECRLDPCRCKAKSPDELVREAIGHISFYFENEKVTGALSTNELRYAMDKLKRVVIADAPVAGEQLQHDRIKMAKNMAGGKLEWVRDTCPSCERLREELRSAVKLMAIFYATVDSNLTWEQYQQSPEMQSINNALAPRQPVPEESGDIDYKAKYDLMKSKVEQMQKDYNKVKVGSFVKDGYECNTSNVQTFIEYILREDQPLHEEADDNG